MTDDEKIYQTIKFERPYDNEGYAWCIKSNMVQKLKVEFIDVTFSLNSNTYRAICIVEGNIRVLGYPTKQQLLKSL